mmetsp:Transcript_8660/g.14935  ORF Transcript_8660/g.14935 Transcript_8660/m.14935 type:complete len:185 (-) Transcript_8660:204-758(-)|eukprot:CAMPEP_0119109100 /NCGR_PEP_ID=MMETSP1180-20130426/17226_1 /TAXON_ID=3052 ORGANISM="Chlamydomonas cf sp, Strain CCMP681" /NCGR_SAMPLE_ID=MMETSP1180 /ASSEMBLY_ACC=CAM_ASM_000741 /LENGTH=184 /DNA_ID=CAMNT_0007094813 /DNA_START=132 /DNA_END=686 /DNA_ORIENTATION=-
MSAWRAVAHFAIPPALVLTVLLILPTPAVVQRGLLIFTKKVLFFNVAGHAFKLVHVMIALTAIALTGCAIHVHKLKSELAGMDMLTPNQRMGLLGRKWREERNFWIAALAFLLWAMLHRFYSLLIEHVSIKDRVKTLTTELSQVRALLLHQGVAPPVYQEPTAPPDGGKQADAGPVQRGKKKAT